MLEVVPASLASCANLQILQLQDSKPTPTLPRTLTSLYP